METLTTLPTDLADPAPPPDPGLDLGDLLGVRAPGVEQRIGFQRSLRREVLVQQPVVGARVAVHELLRQEARYLASLDHPHILPVHAVREGPSGPQLITPRVHGAPWSERLEQPWLIRERFGAQDVLAWHCRVLLQVCEAVGHAHEQGLLHLDLRPESVWIGDLGEVYLTSWTLGRPADRARVFGREEAELAGSASHFAPEMLMRTAGRPGPRTDVYQLGGLLYRILAGEAPHQGADLDEAMRHVLFSDPDLPEGAPPSLTAVCKRAMSRNPGARFPDARTFAVALQAALAQRGAWELEREADRALDVLTRLLRDPGADRAEVFRTFGAVRLGYQRALAEAPSLAGVSLRQDRATELVVRWCVAANDVASARALLAEMPDPPSHLQDLFQDETPEPRAVVDAYGKVPTWMIPITLAWVATPILAWWLPNLEAALVAGAALSAVATACARVPSLVRGQAPPPILTWSTATFAGAAGIAALGWRMALPPADTVSLMALVGLLGAGSAAFVIHRSLLAPAIAYGAVAVFAWVQPGSWPATMVVAHLLLAASLGMGAGGKFGRR
jgi:hypothetical protein